jgi:serine/threonine protein kinase
MTNRDFVGKTLGPYKLEAQLGQGGMASVYKAFQVSVKRYVAIKVMLPDVSTDPGFVERFEREAQVIAALEHPHILPVIDYGTVDGIHYLVMRYLDGGSLDQRMRRQALGLEECSKFLSQVASALDYAHRRGVIHRDIKPNNIMLDSEGNGYLTDFGIARMMQSDHKLTATGSVMGTPAYMSPEQGMGRPVDGRSDIYTLGVVLYEMVLNRLPFNADTSAALIFQHVYERPIPPQTINPNLTDPVIQVLDRALAKNPDDRFQSASELATSFNDAIHGRPPTPPPSFDVMGTLVGGSPQQPVVPRQTPSTNLDYGRPYGTPPSGATAAGPMGPNLMTAPPGYPPGGTTATATPARSPLPFIIGAIVILLLLAGGGFLVATTINNNNATSTQVAMLGQSATAVQGAINSTGTATQWTKTPTPTDTPTNTNTPTNTPSNTPTNTPTDTPNATQTSAAASTATAIAQAFQSSTALAATVIADQNTQTAVAIQAANGNATSTAVVLTSTAQRISTRQTATAAKADTLTAQPPKTKTTATLTPLAVNQTVQDTLNALSSDGTLSATDGSVVTQDYSFTQDAAQEGYDYWQKLDNTDKLADFVMGGDITFDAPDTDNGCGFLVRYTGSSSSSTFYSAMLFRDGNAKAYVHDKAGYRNNDVFKEQPTTAIKKADGSTNRLVVVGIADTFTIYINGTKILSFSEKNYKTGSVAVMASRGTKSTHLSCAFANVFVYSLNPGSGGGGGAAFMSSNPDDILGALVSANLAPSNATLAYGPKQDQIDLSQASIFSATDLSNTKYTNFAMSTDITLNTNTKNTGCGLFYNGRSDAQGRHPDMVTLLLATDQFYGVQTRQNGTWATDYTVSGFSKAVKTGKGVTIRVTLVNNNNHLTIYLNGSPTVDVDETTFTSGIVGYYMTKDTTADPESCVYAQTLVWKW